MSADIDILIRARDMASKTVRGVRGELGKLDGVGSKAARNLSTNLVRVGAAAAVGLAGGVALGIRGLGRLERLENQTAAVIESTGAAAGQTTQSILAHADALERLTTAEAEGIQEGQNMLLTFTQIGKEAFPEATKATVNLAIAMAKGDVANADFKGSALQVGKALNDPIRGLTSLRRAGIQFTDSQEDQVKALVKSGDLLGAQKIILSELETQFGKAGEAAGTGFEADLRRIEHAGGAATEALARGLMPVLSRAATWLSTKLADPAVIQAVTDLGNELGEMAGKAMDFIESVDFRAIGNGLKMAKDAAGAIVGAFMSLPPWVQQAVVTGWGLNKLTGGALGDVVGALGKGLIKGVLGMNAGVVNINAGIVKGGGLPLGGAAGAAGGGIAAKVGAAIPFVAITAAAVAAVAVVQQHISAQSTAHGQALEKQTAEWLAHTPNREQLANGLNGVKQGIADIKSNPLMTLVQGEALTSLQAMESDISAQIARLDSLHSQAQRTKDDTVAAQNRTRDATIQAMREDGRGLALVTSATQRTAAAIRDKEWSVTLRPSFTSNVNVSVTAANVRRAMSFQSRLGPANGSWGRHGGPVL